MIPDQYIAYLNLVANCKKATERRNLLKVLCRDKKFIKAVKLVCNNTVKSRLRLTERQKNQLKPHAKTINYIARSTRSGTRAIVQSGGGFLSVLLPIVTTLVGAAINGANS